MLTLLVLNKLEKLLFKFTLEKKTWLNINCSQILIVLLAASIRKLYFLSELKNNLFVNLVLTFIIKH